MKFIRSSFPSQVSKVTGGAASKLARIKIVRKNVARILTVINQTQKQELRKFYKVRYRNTLQTGWLLQKHWFCRVTVVRRQSKQD